MNDQTLKSRIAAFAGRIVMGATVKQSVKETAETGARPTREQVADAREKCRAFAALLHDLSTARLDFDLAVADQRSALDFDLAGAVERGEELIDPEQLDTARRRAALKLEGVWRLVNRETTAAARAAGIVKSDAIHLARAARAVALEWVQGQLPDAFDKPGEIAAQSRLVKRGDRLISELETVQGLRTVGDGAGGSRLPSYRLEALPEKPQILPPDGLDPYEAARSLEAVLEAHGRAGGFLAELMSNPVKEARKEGEA